MLGRDDLKELDEIIDRLYRKALWGCLFLWIMFVVVQAYLAIERVS